MPISAKKVSLILGWEDNMPRLVNGIVSAATVFVTSLSFSAIASAADLVNKPLIACLAEKKPMGDVKSCGKKWKIGSSAARVAADGTATVEVGGLVLDDVSVGDANGTADGVDAIAVAVLCDGKVAAQAEPTPLSKQGAAKFAGKLAVPQNCASPMVVVRERYECKIGGWLAGAGQ
jgi:hypothetical protein